jgi:hypothetical protein
MWHLQQACRYSHILKIKAKSYHLRIFNYRAIRRGLILLSPNHRGISRTDLQFAPPVGQPTLGNPLHQWGVRATKFANPHLGLRRVGPAS